jgi:hypothetical protein
VESSVNEIIAKRMNKKQTSCPFPARGTYGRGSEGQGSALDPPRAEPFGTSLSVFASIRLIPSSDDPVAALKG